MIEAVITDADAGPIKHKYVQLFAPYDLVDNGGHTCERGRFSPPTRFPTYLLGFKSLFVTKFLMHFILLMTSFGNEESSENVL